MCQHCSITDCPQCQKATWSLDRLPWGLTRMSAKGEKPSPCVAPHHAGHLAPYLLKETIRQENLVRGSAAERQVTLLLSAMALPPPTPGSRAALYLTRSPGLPDVVPVACPTSTGFPARCPCHMGILHLWWWQASLGGELDPGWARQMGFCVSGAFDVHGVATTMEEGWRWGQGVRVISERHILPLPGWKVAGDAGAGQPSAIQGAEAARLQSSGQLFFPATAQLELFISPCFYEVEGTEI